MANIWSKMKMKNGKSTYDLSKELNVSEDKIKEVLSGDRQVPHEEVDKVYNALNTPKMDITDFEYSQIKKYFRDNDIQDLKKKFGYKTIQEIADTMGISVVSLYKLRNIDDFNISKDMVIKCYEFFTNDWNKKVNKKVDKKEEKSYVFLPQIKKEELDPKVLEWYYNTNLTELRKNEELRIKDLLEKINIRKEQESIYCKFAKGKEQSNWFMIQQLYNYYNNIPLLETYKDKSIKVNNIKIPIKETPIKLIDIPESIKIENELKETNTDKLEILKKELEETKRELARYRYLIDLLINK